MTAFEREVPLRWRDTDALGHVNHAVFLTYLEIGRDALHLATLGSAEYAVARIELDYRAEIVLAHESVLVRVEIERLGGSSITTRESIVRPDGVVAAEAKVVCVLWDTEAHALRRLDDSHRQALAPWLAAD